MVHKNTVEVCIHCKTKRSYSEEFDAYYCKICDYWLEKICPDKTCEFCSKRPKYPNDKVDITNPKHYELMGWISISEEDFRENKDKLPRMILIDEYKNFYYFLTEEV